MEILQLQIILVTFIVSSQLTLSNFQDTMDTKFQNLFGSISKNNTKNIGTYGNSLKKAAIIEKEAFDSMKDELQLVRHNNGHKQRNIYNDGYISSQTIAFKREIHESDEFDMESEETGSTTRAESASAASESSESSEISESSKSSEITKTTKRTKSRTRSTKSTKSARRASTSSDESSGIFKKFKPSKSTTNTATPKMKWYTVSSPDPTPSTDSWDEELGFNKIQVVERIIDPTRGYLDQKYYCEHEGRSVRKGSHYFEHEKCLVWHCPKWPIPVGVYDFVFYNCTHIDFRMFPLYHKECRVHRCPTKRVNLEEPYILPTVPVEYRTVKSYWNGTVWPESDGEWKW